MSFRRILLATDGSPGVRAAIERALELARLTDGEVTALYVMDDTAYAYLPAPTDYAAFHDALRAEGERAVAAVAEAGRSAGVPVATLLRDGHPAHTIVEVGRDFDVIVMGRFGHRGLAHLLVGSVAERVLRHANVPVLVVRPER